ncbi:MAG TPA: DUF6364 family protein [Candidatus Limnocylindrales bacterium]|nr:DUF6364 family protein [Candidatus Limnocylindrales bacterium]
MRQNLTVQLDEGTIRKARVLAAKRATSISRLIAAEIERLTDEDDAYMRAKSEALRDMRRGFDLGSHGRLVKRDELYDR